MEKREKLFTQLFYLRNEGRRTENLVTLNAFEEISSRDTLHNPVDSSILDFNLKAFYDLQENKL